MAIIGLDPDRFWGECGYSRPGSGQVLGANVATVGRDPDRF